MKDLFEIYIDIINSNLPNETKIYLTNLIKTKNIGDRRARANKTGFVQIDINSKTEVNRYNTAREANVAIGKKENASGISDAANSRNGKHFAYGYLWCHSNDWDDMSEEEKATFE